MDEMSDEQKEYEALELAKLLGLYHYYLLFSMGVLYLHRNSFVQLKLTKH